MRTILLTGASGVVGAALLPRLSGHRVICLAHRNIPPGAEVVMGDLRARGLGLAERARLAREVEVVIHCAALTDFSVGAAATRELNVAGTGRLLEFAAEAGATLHYVSSAFVARTDLSRADVGTAAADPAVYLESKRAAEKLVRDSGIPGTILRPSVVIGDAATGAIARFQGLHLLAADLLRNKVPLVPLRPDDRVDLVPQDVLAAAIAAVVDGEVRGEHWITAGPAAPTARRVVELIVEAGVRAGMRTRAPRLVDPEMIDRLVRPVFIDALPPVTRRRFEDLIAMSALMASPTPFPTTLGVIPGCRPLVGDELVGALARSVDYFVRDLGWAGVGV